MLFIRYVLATCASPEYSNGFGWNGCRDGCVLADGVDCEELSSVRGIKNKSAWHTKPLLSASLRVDERTMSINEARMHHSGTPQVYELLLVVITLATSGMSFTDVEESEMDDGWWIQRTSV